MMGGAGSEGLAEEARVRGFAERPPGLSTRVPGPNNSRAPAGKVRVLPGMCCEQPGRTHRVTARSSAWQCHFASVTGDPA